MKSSFKYVRGGISFEVFCKIIDDLGGYATQRDGMHDVYMSRKNTKGCVTRGDASQIASAILAQDLNYQW